MIKELSQEKTDADLSAGLLNAAARYEKSGNIKRAYELRFNALGVDPTASIRPTDPIIPPQPPAIGALH